MLGFELDALNKTARVAGFADIAEVPHELIQLTLQFQKRLTSPRETVNVRGISFTEYAHAMEQNAKYREVTLPFIAMDAI